MSKQQGEPSVTRFVQGGDEDIESGPLREFHRLIPDLALEVGGEFS
jgi:hypothetical protein